MPKSLHYPRLGLSAGFSPGRFFSYLTPGVVWGGIAGSIIGTGISLSIGLFYSSALSLIGLVIFVSALLGAVFGQVMAHLLSEDEIIFTQYAQSHPLHSLAGETHYMADLTDHRTLKNGSQVIIPMHRDVTNITQSVNKDHARIGKPIRSSYYFSQATIDSDRVVAGQRRKH